MKVIPKLLRGGYASSFTTYKPVQEPSGNTTREQPSVYRESNSRSSSSTEGQVTLKDLFNMLKDIDGLENDMTAVANDLMNMFLIASLTGNTSDIATTYLKSLIKVKMANSNKAEFDTIITDARKEGVMDLPAISSDGRSIIVLDRETGKLTEMEYKEYLNNSDQYAIMTNSNIAYLRTKVPDYAFNKSLVEILNNGMSFKKFQDLVDKAKTTLGSSDMEHKGLINASSQEQAMQGLQVLKQLSEQGAIQAGASMTVQGLYKYNITTKQQTQLIALLISYMKKVLPEKAKTWAAVTTNISDPDKAIESLLLNYLGSQHSNTYKFDIDLEESSGTSSSSKGTKSSTDDLKLNTPSLFISGMGTKENFTINPGTEFSFVVPSTCLPLTDAQSKPLGTMCTLEEAAKGEWAGSLLWNKATMGGRKIDIRFFNLVLLEDGNAYSIDYPINPDGTPDLRPMVKENREKAIKDLKKRGINIDDPNSVKNNISTINAVMLLYELPAMFNSVGEMITDNWGRFAVMNGIADNKILGVDPVTRTVPILNEIEDESVLEQRDRILSEKLDYTFKTEYGNLFSADDIIYEGTLWVPVNNDYFNALVGSGTKITPGLMQNIYNMQEQRSIINNYVKTPPL